MRRFPCADDIAGSMSRIQVPAGFRLEFVGRFPGQPMQITYGSDGRLYATLLTDAARDGAVYAMDASGSSTFYAGPFVSPVGLAFQPGTDVLYVSSRVTTMQGGRCGGFTAMGACRNWLSVICPAVFRSSTISPMASRSAPTVTYTWALAR
ncbi:MAG: hypothetical protein U0694_18805 [Anaerolineae bacterium]